MSAPRPVPDYADVMTVAEFVEAVRSYCFTNDDGVGYLVRDGLMHDEALPSELFFEDPAPDFTHVAWFNK